MQRVEGRVDGQRGRQAHDTRKAFAPRIWLRSRPACAGVDQGHALLARRRADVPGQGAEPAGPAGKPARTGYRHPERTRLCGGRGRHPRNRRLLRPPGHPFGRTGGGGLRRDRRLDRPPTLVERARGRLRLFLSRHARRQHGLARSAATAGDRAEFRLHRPLPDHPSGRRLQRNVPEEVGRPDRGAQPGRAAMRWRLPLAGRRTQARRRRSRRGLAQGRHRRACAQLRRFRLRAACALPGRYGLLERQDDRRHLRAVAPAGHGAVSRADVRDRRLVRRRPRRPRSWAATQASRIRSRW